MANWIELGQAETFATEEHQCIEVDGHPLVVVHRAGTFYVIANICPHAGLPLGEGDCRGLVLTCPFHGYAYNVKSGANIDFPDLEVPVRTYPTKVEAGKLWADTASD